MEEQTDAVQIFMEQVIQLIYIGTKASTIREIEKTDQKKVTGTYSEMINEARKFYNESDNQMKKEIINIIELSLQKSIFNFLVLLDNCYAGYPVQDIPSRYSLFLNEYENEENMYKLRIPATSHLINEFGAELHDIFTEFVKTQANQNEKDIL